MSPKTIDKIWTIVLYIVSSLVVLLLVSLIGYILFKGVGAITPIFYLVIPNSVRLEEVLALSFSIHSICL